MRQASLQILLKDKNQLPPKNKIGEAFAPSNIALCKYWGKRDQKLNLPVTDSLSVSLADLGTKTRLSLQFEKEDSVIYNDEKMLSSSPFCLRLSAFIDLIRPTPAHRFDVIISANIPLAAGLASSASGFASLTLALNNLFDWNLTHRELSILARLGSGSASRSIETGFVQWHAGSREDGLDSFAEKISDTWKGLRVGVLIVSQAQKNISSKEAMQRTITTSPFYPLWPKKVEADMGILKKAIATKNFTLFGETAESNALAMHATMLSSWPPVCYFLPESLSLMNKIWKLRKEGLPLFFTEDAGPNLKLLFEEKNQKWVTEEFPDVKIVAPFDYKA